jgi:4-hydroxybenzoate polyprenyltransferase
MIFDTFYFSVVYFFKSFCFQLYTLNINNPMDCSIKFVSNQRVGLLLFGGIVVGTLFKSKENSSEESRKVECNR